MGKAIHTERELIRCQRLSLSLMEKRIYENNDDLAEIGEQLNAIVHYNIGEDLKMLYMNTHAMKYTGISLEEMLQMGPQFFAKYMHPKTVTETFPRYLEFYKNNDDFKTCADIELVRNYRGKEYYPLLNIAKIHKKSSGWISLCLPLKDLDRSVSKIFLTLYEDKDNFFVKHYEQFQRLTQRERTIVSLIADGLSSVKIADKLGISKLTVDTHRKNIVRKLEVSSFAGLIKYAVGFNS